jgi:hypothetical protein
MCALATVVDPVTYSREGGYSIEFEDERRKRA